MSRRVDVYGAPVVTMVWDPRPHSILVAEGVDRRPRLGRFERTGHQVADPGNFVGCCARAASGQAAAAPPTNVMNSRRLMCSPQSETSQLITSFVGKAALCITANFAANVSVGSIVPVGRPRHPAGRDSNAPEPDPLRFRPPTGSMCHLRSHAPQQRACVIRSPRWPAPATCRRSRGRAPWRS
jgi:hypothetical protein